MKPVHLPVTGHDLLAVERFRDETRHMAVFLVLKDCSHGQEGQYIRRFLNEDGYAGLLEAQRHGDVRVYQHAGIIEGHIVAVKPKKRRGK